MNDAALAEIRLNLVALKITFEQIDPEGSLGDPIGFVMFFGEEIFAGLGLDPWERFALAFDLVADVFLAG